MSTQRHEIAAWLGPALADLSDEQVDQIADAFETIQARYEGKDADDDAEAARSGAAQVIIGDDDLETIAAAYLAARRLERERMAALTGAIAATAAQGESEVRIADMAGVTRMTVRKALGK